MYYNKLMLNSLQNLINIVPIYKIQFLYIFMYAYTCTYTYVYTYTYTYTS